jgi:hypothetical protein
VFTDHILDTDGDGAADQLVLAVETDLLRDGTAIVSGRLVDAHGAEIARASASRALTAGETRNVELAFFASDIISHGVGGPYSLRDVSVFLSDAPAQPDFRAIAHTTAPYGLDACIGNTWHNHSAPFDVDGVNGTTPRDVLVIINYINLHSGDGSLPPPSAAPPPYYDVNDDGYCTANDVVQVVNYINGQLVIDGEGEPNVDARATPPATNAFGKTSRFFVDSVVDTGRLGWLADPVSGESARVAKRLNETRLAGSQRGRIVSSYQLEWDEIDVKTLALDLRLLVLDDILPHIVAGIEDAWKSV